MQEPIDFKASRRNAWIYRPDIRRVRKAPAIGYDNPTGPGGLQTSDDQKGFNGAFDRYRYDLLGKREIHVPYHNYVVNDPEFGDGGLDDRLTLNHVNPDYIRFELHCARVGGTAGKGCCQPGPGAADAPAAIRKEPGRAFRAW